MRIVNLTQHAATPEQLASGVLELPSPTAAIVRQLLTFDTLPNRAEVYARAQRLALIASADSNNHVGALDATHAMIGGAPWLMGPLEAALREHGVYPLYAFSVRESAEQVQPDGSVRKVNVFKHGGFVHV